MKSFIPLLISFSLYAGNGQLLNPNRAFTGYNEMPRDCNGATFVNTDGIQKLCSVQSDCYNMREPIFWCRLAHNQRWTDEGCFCDATLKACIIERVTILGPTSAVLNYAYCTPKVAWYCPPGAIRG